ncbi:Dihydroflavonol 4-reductase family [Melia azedarach]|uniref:Dihydroflavonol 4-reductase family n=1 Tax=Melia azedarach TaxID=155640 RepID=A0ACC1YUI6_MELAZ|nr:Dihydroflavonol 4-reductase family [Melia azedarach]
MDEEVEEAKGTVCVTGGTGYVASWLIMKLLQHGYSVHATVRFSDSSGRKKDHSYIANLPGASKKLKIYNADLNQPESFNSAIEGCMGVFHLAHPMEHTSEPEEVVTKRSVEGLLGILKASMNSKTVKRVVYTSSLATIAYNNNNHSKSQSELDETMWSDLETCRSMKNLSKQYLVSKIVTEKIALEYAEKHGIELVSLVLPLVVGPFICSTLPSSVYIVLTMILGKRDQYKYLLYSYNMVHIDDVASAGIFLLENPNSKGRYICSSVELTIDEMFEYLSKNYPEFELPTAERLKEIKAHERPKISSKKLLDCGFKFKYGMDEMFLGAIHSCKETGLL